MDLARVMHPAKDRVPATASATASAPAPVMDYPLVKVIVKVDAAAVAPVLSMAGVTALAMALVGETAMAAALVMMILTSPDSETASDYTDQEPPRVAVTGTVVGRDKCKIVFF